MRVGGLSVRVGRDSRRQPSLLAKIRRAAGVWVVHSYEDRHGSGRGAFASEPTRRRSKATERGARRERVIRVDNVPGLASVRMFGA
jgi:hypothetical protein